MHLVDINIFSLYHVIFRTTEHPQLLEFEVASCRTCRLRSKKAKALRKAGVFACQFDTP